MCRAGGKSRARADQSHIIFFASPYLGITGLPKEENLNEREDCELKKNLPFI